MKKYTLTKEAEKRYKDSKIDVGGLVLRSEQNKKIKTFIAKELHLQKEEIKQIIIDNDEEYASEDTRKARNRMKESLINKL